MHLQAAPAGLEAPLSGVWQRPDSQSFQNHFLYTSAADNWCAFIGREMACNLSSDQFGRGPLLYTSPQNRYLSAPCRRTRRSARIFGGKCDFMVDFCRAMGCGETVSLRNFGVRGSYRRTNRLFIPRWDDAEGRSWHIIIHLPDSSCSSTSRSLTEIPLTQ